MIRLIQRRLIIPRGDTGSFTIPRLASMDANDLAMFVIFNPLTKKKCFQKEATIDEEVLTVEFARTDTIGLPAGKYVWDIKHYKNPTMDEDEIIDAEEVNSYYAGFSLPVCEVKETAEDWPVNINLNNQTTQEIINEISITEPSIYPAP